MNAYRIKWPRFHASYPVHSSCIVPSHHRILRHHEVHCHRFLSSRRCQRRFGCTFDLVQETDNGTFSSRCFFRIAQQLIQAMQITTKDNGVVSQTPLVGNACILIDSLLDTTTGVTRIVTFTTPVNCIISQCAHSSSVLTVSLTVFRM